MLVLFAGAQGGFAKCYMFTSLAKNKIMAGKVVLKSTLVKERAKQKLLAEIKIHREMNHPTIVKFETFFEDKTAVYILLELCTNNVSAHTSVDACVLPGTSVLGPLIEILRFCNPSVRAKDGRGKPGLRAYTHCTAN